MVHFDVAFPSNPEDILDGRNPTFSYVSRRLIRDEMDMNTGGTVGDVREIFTDFYNQVGRYPPRYFPQEPANRQYNITGLPILLG